MVALNTKHKELIKYQYSVLPEDVYKEWLWDYCKTIPQQEVARLSSDMPELMTSSPLNKEQEISMNNSGYLNSMIYGQSQLTK